MFIRKELFQSLRNEFYYRDETQTKQKKSQILFQKSQLNGF